MIIMILVCYKVSTSAAVATMSRYNGTTRTIFQLLEKYLLVSFLPTGSKVYDSKELDF